MEEDEEVLKRVLNGENPELLVGRPPLAFLSLSPEGTCRVGEMEAERERDLHLRVSVRAHADQLSKVTVFLHESPEARSTWSRGQER